MLATVPDMGKLLLLYVTKFKKNEHFRNIVGQDPEIWTAMVKLQFKEKMHYTSNFYGPEKMNNTCRKTLYSGIVNRSFIVMGNNIGISLLL
jgi:hypothetical protein